MNADFFPHILNSTQTHFTIAQISDLHLHDAPNSIAYERFLQLLSAAKQAKPDLLLLTGDLANDGNQAAYDWLFAELVKSQLPFVCLAGNHDVTIEKNAHLPFDERTFLPCAADARLASQHKIRLQFHPENPKNTENPTHAWQLLLLNSALPARADGALSKQTLAWLDETLAQDSTPACIALHHHPLPVRSAWIDAHRLKNADDFWQIIRHHTHARLVLCGHVHQAQTLIAPSTHACTLLTCPAASRQFLPKAHDFALDTAPIGLRIIRLTARDFTSEIWRVADGVISVE